MATFNTAFGSLPGYKEMMGTTNSTAGGEEKTPTVYGGQTQAKRSAQQPAQTFAKMQEQGLARPAAPAAPTPTAFGQYGGSQQGQQFRNQLQQRLTEFGQAPSRYDTESFKQIRGAQAANLQAEYQGQKKALDEELAGRGLYASSIGGGRMGDLAGQQARATASLDAELLQRAADTQAQDRAQFMQSGQGLAELAGSQDLQQFEANRVGKAAEFEQGLRSAEFGQRQYEQAGQEALQSAQAEENASQVARQFDLSALGQTGELSLGLQRLLGSQETERAGLTGQLGGTQTLAGQQQTEQRRQFDVQQALQEQLGLGGLGVQQQEVGIKQQALQQSAADSAAERGLREQMQTRELSASEQQQLRDITSRRELQTQQITAQQAESAAERDIRLRLQSGQITAEQAQQERQLASAATLQSQQLMQQAQQFGLSLNETQADRLQKYGLSVQELGLRSQQVQQEGALQGRQISVQEAQNTAQNQIEREKIGQQAQQFGLSLNEQQTARVQQFGISTQELALKTQQVQQEYAIQGQRLTLDQAQNIASNGLERDRISQQASQFGLKLSDDKTARAEQLGISQQQIGQEAQRIANQNAQFGRQMTATELQNTAQNNLEQGRLTEATASRITGVSESALERALRTSLQSGEQTFQRGESALERTLRTAMQSNQLTYDESQFARNFVQNAERIGIERTSAQAQQELARNQLFMQLAQALGTLSPTQIQNIVKTGTAQPGGGDGDNTGNQF